MRPGQQQTSSSVQNEAPEPCRAANDSNNSNINMPDGASNDNEVGVEQSRRSSFRRSRRRHLIGAIDQGTSSTRFLVFENKSGRLIASSQIELKRIVPKEGWVEMDADAIMDSVYATIQQTCNQLGSATSKLKCIGICNQRESTVVWDAKTGRALYNVILWMDNRTKDLVDDMIDSVPGRDFNFLKDKTGLPMSTYFSAYKLKWLIDNVPVVREALKENRLRFGTVDSWILWNLTGNHLTDATNASRTFLMDIETLEWNRELCKRFDIPIKILPKILASADDFGQIQHGLLKGLPITGVIGDQSAALFGHNCLQLGQTKATYGTGCFIMQNIGPGPLKGALKGVQREAKRGLITTVGFKLRDRPACYALEGSIKIAGAALTWMRDNIQLIKDYDECDQLVDKTTNSAGVFFVPALGGLYSPYWDPNAAGLFIGLSQFTRREHMVRATFDSIAFQTNDILSLMRGVTRGLMIDGGLCKSNNMCQILADITGCQIVRPSMCETSALGAAMVAGCGAGIWTFETMLAANASIAANACRLTPEPAAFQSTQQQQQPDHDVSSSSATRRRTDDQKGSRRQQQRLGGAVDESKLLALIKAAPIVEQEQQQQRNRSQARQITNRDAGGGVNDDAGGGGFFVGHLDDVDNTNSDDSSDSDDNGDEEDKFTTSLSSNDSEGVNSEEEEEDDDDDDEGGVTTSGEFSSASSEQAAACNKEVQMVTRAMQQQQRQIMVAADCGPHMPNPEIHEIPPPISMAEAAPLASSSAAGPTTEAPTASSFPRATPSSGYSSSSDLYETMNCCQYDNNEPHHHQHHHRTVQTTTSKTTGRLSSPTTCAVSTITAEQRAELVETWRAAVGRSMEWTKVHHEEIRRADYQRLSSMPVTMYLFFSIGIIALSGLMSPNGIFPKV